jgi:iron complex transport system ATP-binding protein
MLARALVGDPEILIADEPTSGLDPRHALDTLHRLHELARAGKLIIAALHDLTLAARYATRLIALDHGRIVCDGHPHDVLNPNLLRSVFEVEGNITGADGAVIVDYVAPLNRDTASASPRAEG